MTSSTSSSSSSSPLSSTFLEGYQLMTVPTMPVVSAHEHTAASPSHSSGSRDNIISTSQPVHSSRGGRVAGRASVTLLRASDIRLNDQTSWDFLCSPPSSCDDSPDIPPLETPSPQTQTQGSYCRSRSIARATRPPNLPLTISTHDGISNASGSPPERLLAARVPTPSTRRRRRTFTVPPDAPEQPNASSLQGVIGASSQTATPEPHEPSSAHSHRSFATFGGDRDTDSPGSKGPSLSTHPSTARSPPLPRTRHQSLDAPQSPPTLLPRQSSISHSGGSGPRSLLAPARTTSLATIEAHSPNSLGDFCNKSQSHNQRQQTRTPNSNVAVSEDQPNPCARSSEDSRVAGYLGEILEMHSPLGPQVELADQDAMIETMSLDHDVRSESGMSVAPLLPRPSTDSHSYAHRASSDIGHSGPSFTRHDPRPARITQSLDHSHFPLSTSTLGREQRAVLIKRNRKLEQVFGEPLSESDVGQFVVEPSVGATTVLTRVEDAWAVADGPEWERDDCVPQIMEAMHAPVASVQRKRSKIKRSLDLMRAPVPTSELHIYVSRETKITETVAPAQASPVRVNRRKATPPSPGSPAWSSPPVTPFQTPEEATRARRRAQLAKLQRMLGSPISPRFVRAPDMDEVPTCGMVRSPSESSFGSQRKVPLRERVKSFVIPSPIHKMSETERRLARKRASKLEHLFGDTPPEEMYLPVVKGLEPEHALGPIRETEGMSGGVPGLTSPSTSFPGEVVAHQREATENGMFISTSPAAAAHPSPDDTYEGYRHSLQGLMSLVENDQIQLGSIIDQLEPQLYNHQVQSSIVLQLPGRSATVRSTALSSSLGRRSSAPPLPTFSQNHPGNDPEASSSTGSKASTDHSKAPPVGFVGSGIYSRQPQPSATAAKEPEADLPRPSLQTCRKSCDPFAEFLRAQSEGLRRAEHSCPEEQEREPQTPTTASPPTSTTTPRRLPSLFSKRKFPTTPSRLTFLQTGSNSAVTPHRGLATATNATETDTASAPGTLRKKDRRGRKFSKLFSAKAANESTTGLGAQVIDPFYIRRQTLDGVLAEMRRTIMLDTSNGQMRTSDAQKLFDMLEELNRMREGTPWAELKEDA